MNRVRLIPLGVAISLLILLIGYISYMYLTEIIRENKYSELKSISNLKKQQLVYWYSDKITNIKVSAQSPFFADAIETWGKNGYNAELKSKIIEKLSTILSDKDFSKVAIFSPSYQLLVSTDNNKEDLDIKTKGIISKVVESKGILSTDLYYSQKDNKVNLDFLAPVISLSDSSCIAVVLFRINPYISLFPNIQSWPTTSKTSESLILRLENDSIVFLNELRHKKNTALKFKLPATKSDFPTVQAALGQKGLIEGVDYRGYKSLAYIDQLPQYNCFLVTKIDKSEAFYQIRVYSIVLAIISLLLIILSGTIIFIYFRTLQKNTYQKLYEIEKVVANTHGLKKTNADSKE